MKAIVTITFVTEDTNDSFWTMHKLRYYFRGWMQKWLGDANNNHKHLQVVVKEIE